jgi:hypothetical protein
MMHVSAISTNVCLQSVFSIDNDWIGTATSRSLFKHEMEGRPMFSQVTD